MIESKELILTTRSNQIDLTNDQKEALLKVADFIESTDKFFLLAGYSGTGKTTIAENIVGYVSTIKKRKISLLAPTNAAKNRISEKIRMPYNKASTIHRELYSIDDNGRFIPNGSFTDPYYIIDECSMIDTDILRQIIVKVMYGKTKTKIIFMGDVFQLEPVGDNPEIFNWENVPVNKLYLPKTEDELKVPVFFEHNKHELREVKRYDGTLLKIATDMRNYQKPVYNEIETNDLREVPTFTSILPKLIIKDADYMIITSTNKRRLYYNSEVRSFKFSKQPELNLEYPQNKENFVAINNSIHYSNGEIFQPKNLVLLEEFEIKKILNSKEVDELNEEPRFDTLRALLYIDKTFSTKTFKDTSKYILMMPTLEESSLSGSTILYNWKNKHTELSPIVEGILIRGGVNKRTGENYSTFNKEVIIATYGYAISGHKAQGQEWDYVFIDGTFLSNSWDAGKWYYTAITRAKRKVQVRTNKYLSVIPKDAVMEK